MKIKNYLLGLTDLLGDLERLGERESSLLLLGGGESSLLLELRLGGERDLEREREYLLRLGGERDLEREREYFLRLGGERLYKK